MCINLTSSDTGVHLEFSEDRGPNFRKGAKQYKTGKKRK